MSASETTPIKADIELRNVRKSFGAVDVIHDLDLTIAGGEFVVFVGPSGCGKSTLLRMIAGLEEVTDGDILIGGKDVTDADPAKRGIAMVFQSYALYPHMSVQENLAFGLKIAHTPNEELDRRVSAAADILKINHLLDRRPGQLSGGQRQRVAIGRAIVRKPLAFLFDEPLSNLDAELRVSMRIELARLHRELGNTMVYVTHDQIEAMTMADKIVVMNAGRVEQMGAPLDLYDRPDNLFVAGFLGSPAMNFIAGKAGTDGKSVQLPGGSSISVRTFDTSLAGKDVIFGIRPEHIKLADTNGIAAEVLLIEPTGSETHMTVRLGGQDLVCVMNDRVDTTAGQTIRLSLASERTLFFDHENGNRLSA